MIYAQLNIIIEKGKQMAKKDCIWKKPVAKTCCNCIKYPCIVQDALPEYNNGCKFWLAKGKFVALLTAIRIAVGRAYVLGLFLVTGVWFYEVI